MKPLQIDFPVMRPIAALKIALWIYFLLILLEGVLRKWVFPQWSDALFVVRDPLVVLIYLMALIARVFPMRPAVFVVAIFAVTSLVFAIAIDAQYLVTLFGLRTNYLHLPLIFVMAAVFDRKDVVRFGRWFLLFSIPITWLMLVQFNAPTDSWVNVGAGGEASAQLRGALGKIRPPGPFSFVSGVVSYFAFVTAFVFYGWSHRWVYGRVFLIVSTLVLAVAIPISISRSLLFLVLVVLMFGTVAALRDLKRLPALMGPLVAALGGIAMAADTIYVQAFATRWEESVNAGDGDFRSNVLGRMLDDVSQPFTLALDAPIMGNGVGLGTVAGARLTTGEFKFLLTEGELGRMIMELGPVLGFAFIAWRLWLAITLLRTGWRHFLNHGDSLAWLIGGATFMSIVHGQWGPATNLGFAVFGAGLSLAAVNEPEEDEEGELEDEEAEEESLEAPAEVATGTPVPVRRRR